MSAARTAVLGVVLAIAVAALMVGSSLGLSTSVVPLASPAALSGSSSPVAASPVAATASGPAPIAGLPSDGSPLNATGPGSFYGSTALPSASFANETCVGADCYNVTNDVATTVTPSGRIVAAYTTLTDQSPCASLQPYSVSNIAVTSSTNGGGTWSAVQYVGNPTCSATGYPDAWEPSIATLANGTLVLVYVEYNLTAGALPPLTPYTWPPTESRLVLTESYDAGVAWSTPQVLNISNPATAPPGLQFTPALPSVATHGQTIYVTWMSLTLENDEGNIALLVSTTGGASWSPTVPVSTGPGAGYSMDPQVIVGRSGELVIAYTGNVSDSTFFCGSDGCVGYYPPVWEGSVWVATSHSNGTIFNYTDVAPNVPLGTPGWAAGTNPTSYGPFETPAPQLAYSGTTHQLFLAFSAGQVANNSTFCYYGPTGCLADDLYFFNSSTEGVNWTAGNINDTVLNTADIDPSTFAANATDSVTDVAIAAYHGTVYLEAAFYNGAMCDNGACGVDTEVVFSTANDGLSFTTPATIAADYTPTPFAWTGEYDSIAIYQATPHFFWTLDACPAWATTPCGPYPGSDLAVSQVELSTLASASHGATLSFVAAGVGSPANWTVEVLGNERGGPTSAVLSVSGVPEGVSIYFTVPGINETDVRYYVVPGGVSPGSPATLTGNLTVTVTFLTYVPVTIAYNVPNVNGPTCAWAESQDLSGCPSFYPGCLGEPEGNYSEACYSYYFNPIPPVGQRWVPAGQPDSVGLSPLPFPVCWYYMGGIYGYTYCFILVFNLVPLGWTGIGPGSVSTTALNISFTPRGPVTETASFLLSGYCQWDYENFGGTPYLYPYGCENFTDQLTVEEQGLPAGSTWGVTLSGAAGSGPVEAAAGQSIVNNSAAIGVGSVAPWNVPSTTPGYVWVGTPSILSPMLLPETLPDVITYTLEPISSIVASVRVTTLGLPNGLAGNATFEDLATDSTTAVSAVAPGANLTLPGGQYTVTAAPIITTDGVSYYPSEIYSTLAVLGDSNQSGTSPTTIELEGSATVTLAYSPEYWVDVAAGAGGSASPASRWVAAGGTLSLTATPNSGYSFLYWVGTGPGATSGPQALLSHVAIQPGGSVSELAVFGVTPPATWTVTVIPNGIPTGQEYSVSLGAQTYSGIGSFTIDGLATGTYALSVPNVTNAGVSPVRYSLESLSATAGLSGSELTVAADLSLLPVFGTEYEIAISSTGGGTISLAAGSYWEPASSTLSVTATPAAGDAFGGWWVSVADGPSSLASAIPGLELVVATSAIVVASFVPAPSHASTTFSLTLEEKGLPADTMWQVTLTPGAGASGTASTLSADGLNGNYQLRVPVVYAGVGVRYVPNGTGEWNLTVAANESTSVTFTEQVLVSVSTSGSGSASGGGWYDSSTTVTLTSAPAPAGWTFVGWQGTGTGSYSGASLSPTIAPAGPVTETATYAPASNAASSAASTPWSDFLFLGIVVAALLAIGLAYGLISGRRRKPPARVVGPAATLHPEMAAYGTPTAPKLPPAAPPQ